MILFDSEESMHSLYGRILGIRRSLAALAYFGFWRRDIEMYGQILKREINTYEALQFRVL